jgi:hypothetical protein
MKLKRFCIATSISLLGLIGCGKSEIKKLEAENQMLLDFSMQQDAIINEVAHAINHFEENLGFIVQKETMIWNASNKENPEKENQLAAISSHLNAVDSLIQKNEDIIQRLNQRLEASEGKWHSLQKTVLLFRSKLRKKHQEVNQLRNKLGIAIEQTYAKREDIFAISPRPDNFMAASTSP